MNARTDRGWHRILQHEPMPADLMAIAHVRRLLLELGIEEAPEQIVPAALGYSVWVSLPIAELAGRTPKELVADAEGSAALRRWIVARLGVGS